MCSLSVYSEPLVPPRVEEVPLVGVLVDRVASSRWKPAIVFVPCESAKHGTFVTCFLPPTSSTLRQVGTFVTPG